MPATKSNEIWGEGQKVANKKLLQQPTKPAYYCYIRGLDRM